MNWAACIAIILIIGWFVVRDLRGAFGSGSEQSSVAADHIDSIPLERKQWPAPVSQVQDYGRAVGDAIAAPQVRGPLASQPMPMSGPLFFQYNDPVAYEQLMQEQAAGPPAEENHWQSWSPLESADGQRLVNRLSPNLGSVISFDAAVAQIKSGDTEANDLLSAVVGEFYSAGHMKIFIERAADPRLRKLAGDLWMSDEQINDGQWRVAPFIDQTHDPQLIVDRPEGQRQLIRVKQRVAAGDRLIIELRPTTNSDHNGFICRMVARGDVLLSGKPAFMKRASGGLVLCPEPNTTISAMMSGALWVWPVGCALTACTTRVVIQM